MLALSKATKLALIASRATEISFVVADRQLKTVVQLSVILDSMHKRPRARANPFI